MDSLTSLSINYAHAEPHFEGVALPRLCPRKPNFVGPWTLVTDPDEDFPGEYFRYFTRHTSDDRVYIVDILEVRHGSDA